MQALALAGEHHVERQFVGRHAEPCGAGTDRIGERRLVVGLVGHLEQQVEAADEAAAELVARPLVVLTSQQPRPERRDRAAAPHLVGQRAIVDLLVDGVGQERVERALEPEDQAHGARRDLAGHRQPVGVGRR